MWSKKGFLTLAAIAGALTIGSATGQATPITGPPYYTSINVTLDACNNGGAGLCMPPDSTDPTLSDVAILDQAPPFGIAVEYPGAIDGEVSGQVVGGLYPLNWVPTGEFAIGWLDYLPSDGATPSDHVVLFVNQGSIAPGQTWDTLFPDFAESDIIQELQGLAAGDPDASGNPILYDFEYEDLSPSMLFAPGGAAFDAVAFSDSTIVGSGTSTLFPPVPEPSSWMTLLLGVACLVFLKRRASTTPAR
jgi:hypothetical protein